MGVSSRKFNSHVQKLLFCSVSAACFASLAVAQPAYSAGNTYLIELGSFDSKQDAEQKWQKLKDKNPDLLGKLTPHVTALAMSPDDKVSYRAEAGPLDSRDSAVKICSALQDKGAECAVVETAMFADDAAPEPAAPAITDTHAPTKAATAQEPSPRVQDVTPSVSYVEGREPKFLDSSAPAAVATNASEPAQVAAAEAPPAVADSGEKPHDMIVPERAPRFLNDAQEAKDSAAPAAQAETRTASEEETLAAPAKPSYVKVASEDDDDAEESPAQSRRPGIFGEVHRKPARAAHAATHRVETAAEETPAAPEKPASNKPGFFSHLFGSSETTEKPVVRAAEPAPAAAQPAPSKAAEASVSVAEAIRVPLTDGESAKPATVLPPAGKAPKQSLTLGGNYWAQINYFANEAQAHDFYERFRGVYPEVADGVRMSISRPFAYSNSSGHVTLKIGAFASLDDIDAICAIAAQRNLHCVSIYEGRTLSEESGNLAHPRELKEADIDKTSQSSGGLFGHEADNSVYWVQLGSYDSPDDAWDKWREIQRHHRKVIGKMSADVSQPASSSAASKLFRLRAGPFGNQAAADYLCGKLTRSGEDCLVVAEH